MFDGDHAAPRAAGASQIDSLRPPVTAIDFSFVGVKNPIRLPSGDQNGCRAPAASSRRVATVDSSDRIQSCVSGVIGLPTMNAIVRPSGEIATMLESG